MNIPHSLPVMAALMLAGITPTLASGSYSTRPPRPPAKSDSRGIKLDNEKYGLGRKVFAEKVTLNAQGDAASQLPVLQRLQGSLPASVKKTKDLTKLAGKLTGDQLAALEYFVHQRYVAK
ncbi:MAG: hypothetical protein EXS36_10665 [Pedosphaera sp.]|nr:hypothetical protein [Pedosphaera sp.]